MNIFKAGNLDRFFCIPMIPNSVNEEWDRHAKV